MNRKKWCLLKRHEDIFFGVTKDIFMTSAFAAIAFVGKVAFNLHDYNSVRVVKAPTTSDNEMIIEPIDLGAQVRDKMRPRNELKEASWVQQDMLDAKREEKKGKRK